MISAPILGILEIEKLFSNLADGITNQTILSKNKILINLYSDIEDKGFLNNKGILEWRLTKNKWSQFREQTTGLYKSGVTGLCYLQSDSLNDSEYVVILSLTK